MKPEDLLNEKELPEDLKWVCQQYKLQPNDPVFVLIAWHWSQTRKLEDAITKAEFAFRKTVDKRVETLAAAVTQVTTLSDRLTTLEKALAPTREEITARLDAAFQPGLAAIRQNLASLVQESAALRELAGTALVAGQRRQVVASVLIGLALGALGGLLLFAR